MSLSFRDHRFEEVKYSIDDCKERDQTYSAPLFVTAEFMNNNTGEIKSQTVFMGDFPLMTERGTFIINGTERVVVSQLVRSPGVYFERTPDKTSDKDIYTAKVIPSRGAWLEFEIDKRDMVGVRVDRKRKQSVTVLLKALGMDERGDPRGVRRLRVDATHPREGPHQTRTTPCSTSTASCVRASRRPRRPPRPCSTTSTSTASATTWPRSVATRSTRSSASRASSRSPRSLEDIVATIKYIVALHAGQETMPGRPQGRGRRHPRRDRRHRPLRQPSPAQRRRAHPEPGPHRPVPDGARRARADDDPGRRGDHAADPDQHPSRRGGDQGVLRHQPALPVHGPEQPAGRPDAQASPVRARPGWSLP
jgi:DNA-directed RNA polymerase subunit beta